MAEAVRFVCTNCHKDIEAWSDGNPYYFDANGTKTYAYHPDHKRLALCIGNDEPHLCLDCGNEFMVDSRSRRVNCPACKSTSIKATFQLESAKCPGCHAGKFAIDPDYFCIS